MKTNNKPKIKNINLQTSISNFIHKLVLYERNNFVGLNIKNEVTKYFKIININPNFLVSYYEYKKMPIFVPPGFNNDAKLYKSSFNQFRDYCLLLLTNANIINNSDFKTCDCFTFKEYVSKIYADNFSSGQGDKVVNVEKYSNVTIYDKNTMGTCVIPLMAYINTFHNLIITALKNTIKQLTLNYSAIYDSTWRDSKKDVTFETCNITNFHPQSFYAPENIAKIIAYPFSGMDKKWFESIIGKTDIINEQYSQFMHEYMMKLKYTIKYNDYQCETIDYYNFVKKYNISKFNQNRLLREIQQHPNESLYLNTFGNSCKNSCWIMSDIFKISLNSIGYMNIDLLIIHNKMVWDNNPNTIKLLQDCNISIEYISWLIPKLKETDFTNTNIFEALKSYNSQIKTVIPIVIENNFSELKLNLKGRNDILKEFIEWQSKNIYVDAKNNVVENKRMVILVEEPTPTITRIKFNMQYCILCEKSNNEKVIECKFNCLVRKKLNIKQPHFCDDCFDLVNLIKQPYVTNDDETRIGINENIIELSFIREKFGLMLLGLKHDDNSTLNILVMDILQTIVSFYIPLTSF